MKALCFLLALMTAWPALADSLRVGLVSFGTAAWEIDTLRRHGLDGDLGGRLETVPLADPAAGEIALQAGGVDAIVTDWLWVSRQRNAGQHIVFVPHSTALGEILVPPASPLTGLKDLTGRRMGIAGGPLDKSWLLLRAYDPEVTERIQPQFGAPPLLSQELAKGRLDAVLTFWPFAARLEAQGFRPIVSMTGVMGGLGFSPPVPMIGYAFSETWIAVHADFARRFLAALGKADDLMRDEAEWTRLQPLTGAPDAATSAALRQRFTAGLLTAPPAPEAAQQLYRVLSRIGGPGLTGGAPTIAPGTFWRDAPP